jgi:hypothetical protein
MLTDGQIIELSKRMNIPLEGVYFKDELPRKLKTNKSYIINLQDSKNDDGVSNEGTHWTFLQIHETPNGKIEPIYFDPYGQPPPEIIKKRVKENFKKYLPYNNKDIQSLMNNACGFYCLALAHFINAYQKRTGIFYTDVDDFLDCFDDLNKSVDWKKNEYILKMFFQAKDPKLRKEIDVLKPIDSIVDEDSGKGIDPYKNYSRDGQMKMEVDIKYINP